jgi:RimJ/RimL family protein N-acetyltransferase
MEGRLVRLRSYEKSDIDAVMKWINDEEVTRFLGNPLVAPLSRMAEEQWIEQAARRSYHQAIFVIETLVKPRYIGAIDLRAINWIDRNAEIGIVIGDKKCWGKGYGTDAMRVLLRLAFDKLGLHRVWLRVTDFNQRGIKSYEKCGFRREGVMREAVFKDGRFHDLILMSLLRSEYAGRSPSPAS